MHFYLVCNMNKIGVVFVICLLFAAATGAGELKSSQASSKTREAGKSDESLKTVTAPRYVSSQAFATHGMGVASIAGVDSRNGRVSSISGIKFLAPISSSMVKTDNKGYFSSVNDKTKITPITKRGDGISGNVRIAPGFIAVSSTAKSGSNGDKETHKEHKESVTKAVPSGHASAFAAVTNGMGVASIAGVDSRNGRYASGNGIHFFSPIDSMIKTDGKGNYIYKSNGDKMPLPLTITKKGNGVSGTIQIMPGSVSVSSSTKSGSTSAAAGPRISNYDIWTSPFMKPMNDIFFQDPFPVFPSVSNTAYRNRISNPVYSSMPEPTFPRIQDPWIEHDKMFNQILSQHNNMMFSNWYYPRYSPFINYW